MVSVVVRVVSSPQYQHSLSLADNVRVGSVVIQEMMLLNTVLIHQTILLHQARRQTILECEVSQHLVTRVSWSQSHNHQRNILVRQLALDLDQDCFFMLVRVLKCRLHSILMILQQQWRWTWHGFVESPPFQH